MFSKIVIEDSKTDQTAVNIGLLAESLLFYKKVVMLVHIPELKELLEFFGEKLLEKLIKEDRLEIFILQQHFGATKLSQTEFGLTRFQLKGRDHTHVLYEAHKELKGKGMATYKFVSKFADLTQPYLHDDRINEQIQQDLTDPAYMKLVLPIYFKKILPGLMLPESYHFRFTSKNTRSVFGNLTGYEFETDLDLRRINEIYKAAYPSEGNYFDFTGLGLEVQIARSSLARSIQLGSEIVTNSITSQIIKQKFDSIITKTVQSQQMIDIFHEYILQNCNRIAEVFRTGERKADDLVNLLEKAVKFREWVSGIPDEKDLVREYYAFLQKETWIDKLPSKTTRFVITTGLGFILDAYGAGGLGTAISTGVSAADTFLLERLLKGWKPNQFINEELQPLIKKS